MRGKGMCMAGVAYVAGGRRVWQGGMHGRGAYWGACMVGGVHGRGHAWQGGVRGRGHA